MRLNSSLAKKMLESTANGNAKIRNENSAIKMLPGFVAKVRVRCGKANCRCARGNLHLAHYHVTHNRSIRCRKYVRRDQLAEVIQACEAHRELQIQLRAGRERYKEMLAQTRKVIKLLYE